MSDTPEHQWQTVDSLQREMERFFTHFHGSKPPPLYFSANAWEPAADIYETPEEIIVLMELPGVPRQSIEVVIEGAALLVRGIRPEDDSCRQGSYCQMEIQRGPFERRLQLPCPIDREQAEGTYADGVLRIMLKKPAAQPSHRLQIHIHIRP